MKINIIIKGVYILLAINMILFLVLLVHKIRSKRKREKHEGKIIIYRNFIKKFILDEIDELHNIKNRKDMSIIRSIILEEMNNASDYKKSKLLELSKSIGLVKEEIEALNKGIKSRKAIAAYRLGELGAIEAIDDLLTNIDKDNRELSYIIFRSLVLLSGTEYLDRIIDYFGEEDFIIKSRILDLISTIDKEDIYPKMKEYLEGHNSLKRVIGFESLIDRGDKRIIPYIDEAIESDNKEIRVAGLKAIIATSTLDCKKVFPMINHLKEDPEWKVRAYFANALRICSDCEDSISILKNMAEDSHYQVRFNACERLLEFGEPGLLALTEILSSEDKFAVEKTWSLLNREITLYNLMDKIKDYKSYEHIVDNIEDYKKSIKGGVLLGAE